MACGDKIGKGINAVVSREFGFSLLIFFPFLLSLFNFLIWVPLFMTFATFLFVRFCFACTLKRFFKLFFFYGSGCACTNVIKLRGQLQLLFFLSSLLSVQFSFSWLFLFELSFTFLKKCRPAYEYKKKKDFFVGAHIPIYYYYNYYLSSRNA